MPLSLISEFVATEKQIVFEEGVRKPEFSPQFCY